MPFNFFKKKPHWDAQFCFKTFDDFFCCCCKKKSLRARNMPQGHDGSTEEKQSKGVVEEWPRVVCKLGCAQAQ